jgi:hypothetical protein
MHSVADWSDDNVRIVCELFAEETRIRNRSNTHLNSDGYKDKTGISYTRKQFKNKWEKLKIDYGIWKKLNKQTGIGWDEGHKIV